MMYKDLMKAIDGYAEASWQDGCDGVEGQSQGTQDKRDRIEDLLNASNLLELLRSEIQSLEEAKRSIIILSQEIQDKERH